MTHGDRHRAEMARVLAAIHKVERRSPVLPRGGAKSLTVSGREAADDSGEALRARIPVDPSMEAADGPSDVVSARTAAGMVRLSKFSDPKCVRARAFYPTTTPPMSLKLVLATGKRQAPITTDVAARTALGDRLPAPPLLDSGAHRTMAYLVEPIVFGTHPMEGEAKRIVAEALIPDLLAAHRQAGVGDEPPSLHQSTFDRLAELFPQVEWSDQWPAPDVLTAECRRLVDLGRTMAIGWAHGDLVFSNLIVADDGTVKLIDWEHARIGPLAADFAKLVSGSYRPAPVLAVLEASATSDDIGPRPGRHTVRHQLAIAQMRELSWWEVKARRAVATGRQVNFDAWTKRSLDLLVDLLDE